MDTTEVAQRLNVTPRQLRVFLRSPFSTYVAVGSGARYEFTEKDLATLGKRFSEWKAAGKPKPERTASASQQPTKPKMSADDKRRLQDEKEWAEEGPVTIPDIRDPRVRARVKASAEAAERRLELQMIAAGIHITQRGNVA